ncbi:uncharacterized protein F4807DRAFT_462335 [Annulohypoxylon truncatum]|uniref:uncharacterized protein n=1 Tax=Annulohypoxylon truncatum TaxID=327061 RepID=UPI0020073164|nr:uncharacterized protein F4807DRAFT_462335 [Annulohypoxylon truncatum]KAI1207893.1 hypothetical protein F4807DRAFT_462335 [Annulohypoxylon truncatum]
MALPCNPSSSQMLCSIDDQQANRTVAVTPSKRETTLLDDASKISRDYATTAIQTLANLRHNEDQPLRFVYVNSHFAARSPAKSNGAVESCAAKPGIVNAPSREKRVVSEVPNIELRDLASALLGQAVN